MSEAIRGADGSGSVLSYTVPRGFELVLELLTFTVATDATAGIHKVRVTFFDTALNQTTAVLRDLNEGGPSQTLRYTYGIGLNSSACIASTGWEMTDALPMTAFSPNTTLTIAAITDGGVAINGDAVANVTLFGQLISDIGTDGDGSVVALLPGLLPG